MRPLPLLAALAPLAVVGCIIELPPTAPEQCVTTADCSSGETCDEGVCWGNPPATSNFAIVMSPPDDRGDLVPTEILDFSISEQGNIAALEFGSAMTVSGRVILACDEGPYCDAFASAAARITFERDARFSGGPRFVRSVDAKGGVALEDLAFSVQLPALLPGEVYDVTIVPLDPVGEKLIGLLPSAMAPPVRFQIGPDTATEGQMWLLGDSLGLRLLTGSLVDAVGNGIVGVQVTARGAIEADEPAVRLSSVGTTTGANGQFELWVSDALSNTYDLVFKAPSSANLPSLRQTGLVPVSEEPGLPIELPTFRMPVYANAGAFGIKIEGADSAGGAVAVPGAFVSVTTELPVEDARSITASYTATGTTLEDGRVLVDLIPNRDYLAQVTPPADSVHATAFDVDVSVANITPTPLKTINLDLRVPLSGTVLDAELSPIEGASVEVRPSTPFRWSLDSSEQSRLDASTFPSRSTDLNGDFRLLIDPELAGHAAVFDLEIVPPAEALAPRWLVEGVAVPAGTRLDTVSLNDIVLPNVSRARGQVTAAGEAIPGAEIRLYEISNDPLICAQDNAPSNCAPPAKLRGIWLSDELGQVVMALPRAD